MTRETSVTAAIRVERCSPGPAHPSRPFPVRRRRCGCTTPPPRPSGRRRRGRRPPSTSAASPRTTPPTSGHAATYIAFDLVQRVWLDNGHRVHFVQNVTDIDDPLLERAARDGDRLARSGRAGDPAVPRGHDGAAGAAAGGLHRRGRGDGRGLRGGAGRCWTRAPPTGSTTRASRTSTSTSPPPRSSATSRGTTSATMLTLSAERGGDPDRAGQAQPARPAAVADATARASRPGSRRWARAGRAGTSSAR